MVFVKCQLPYPVWQRAKSRCEYCRLPQAFSPLPHAVDHFIARQHHGPTKAENLALACFFSDSDNGAFSLPASSGSTSVGSFTDGFSPTAAVSEWVAGLYLVDRDSKGPVYETPINLVGVNQFDAFAQECHNIRGASTSCTLTGMPAIARSA